MSTNIPEKRDYRQEVTDNIIKMLEQGTTPWQKPWRPGALEMPFNPTSERQYRGANAMNLMAVGVSRGYDDPRWMTYRQAQEKGWQVRTGEKGTAIEYWEFRRGLQPEEHDRNPMEGQESEKEGQESEKKKNDRGSVLHRVYTVFNAKQIDGIPEHTPKQHPEFEIVQAGETILKNSGAEIFHDQDDRAFYNCSGDRIHLPAQSAFKTAGDYYGTALHELAHWTGHPTRLDRETLNSSKSFGDPNYAREELRAELASVFLAAERGIPHDPANHAAYVGSWIKALQEDRNEIFRASKDAHRAADFVLGLELNKFIDEVRDGTNQPGQRLETTEYVAQYEPGSGTVDIEQKASTREERIPAGQDRTSVDPLAEPKRIAEEILDNEIPSRPSRKDLDASFAAASAFTKKVLGDNARTFGAQTESGIYRGEMIGETNLHVLQRLSSRSVVAHLKHLLDAIPETGAEVTIAYSRNVAAVREVPSREHEKELSR